MRRSYSREQWSEWLAEQRESGVPISKFCVEKGIPEGSFYHWRKKLSAETSEEDSFVAVSVVATVAIEIDLPCGAKVRVPADRSSVDCVLRSLIEIGANS